MEQNTRNHFTGQPGVALAKSEKELELLYTNNYYKTEAFVLANSGTAEEARDVYQEAFIAVWQNLKAGKFVEQEGSSLEAYLFQIAKYKWYDHLKASKKAVVQTGDEIVFVENGYTDEEEDYIEKVAQHFKKLGDPCRQVLTRFYFMKESMVKIAASFSWTEATAKNNKYRCLQRLRNMVLGKP